MKKAVWAVLFLVLFGMVPAGAEVTQVVDVVGWSRVFGGNVSAARDHAEKDAFDSAVSQVVRTLVPPEDLAANFPLAVGTVLDRQEAYIQGFRVLAHTEGANSVRLLVRVSVDVEGLSRSLADAGLLSSKDRLPLSLVLLEEKNVQDPALSSWWSPALTGMPGPGSQQVVSRELSTAGFQVADSTGAIRDMVEDPAFVPGPMGEEKALHLATTAGAQVLLLGEAVAELAENAMGSTMKSFQGTVFLRALAVDTGEVLASVRTTARTVSGSDQEGGRQAMDLAATDAARKLSTELTRVWKSRGGPARIEVAVRGIQPLSRLVAFRRELKENTPGVSQVTPRGMDGAQAFLEVEFEGSPQDLAQAILLKTYDRFAVSISSVTASRMELELVDKP
ncbi:MAG: CsgG/HfaB family protein [Proteobacteria bacterium]|nr:CsgG/HfaB family protein [Pseudomonadota bacterium]